MQLNALLLNELKHESGNTRKILERVPDQNLGWKPHEKSMTLGRLATHIAELPVWFSRVILQEEFDFATGSFERKSKDTSGEILHLFEERINEACQLLENTGDEVLDGMWTLRRGSQVLFTLPRKITLRNFAFNHIYHHRGQLSVYLRLLQVAVPGMYGPSADELKQS